MLHGYDAIGILHVADSGLEIELHPVFFCVSDFFDFRHFLQYSVFYSGQTKVPRVHVQQEALSLKLPELDLQKERQQQAVHNETTQEESQKSRTILAND